MRHLTRERNIRGERERVRKRKRRRYREKRKKKRKRKQSREKEEWKHKRSKREEKKKERGEIWFTVFVVFGFGDDSECGSGAFRLRNFAGGVGSRIA